MSANRVNKFLLLINERDKLMAEHCKNTDWTELCNYPDERDWYAINISPIDEKIVNVANSIIAKFSIPCRTAKTIEDVYLNHWLTRLIKPKDEIQEEDILSK